MTPRLAVQHKEVIVGQHPPEFDALAFRLRQVLSQPACVTEVPADQIATTRGALLPTEVRKAERKVSSETACKIF